MPASLSIHNGVVLSILFSASFVLPDVAISTLTAHRVRQLEQRLAAGQRWGGHDLVFTNGDGNPLDRANVRKQFHRLLQTADKAETLMERQARVDADPVDPAEVKALLDELHAAGAAKSAEGRKKDYSNVRMPSADELAKVAAEFNGARSS